MNNYISTSHLNLRRAFKIRNFIKTILSFSENFDYFFFKSCVKYMCLVCFIGKSARDYSASSTHK